MRSTRGKLGMGGLHFRAMTFRTVTGLTSDALPIRRKREPGCNTITWAPRLLCILVIKSASLERCYPDLCSCGVGVSSAALFLRAFLAQSVCASAFRYVVLTCFGFGLRDICVNRSEIFIDGCTDTKGTWNVVYRNPLSSRFAFGIPRGISK